MESRLQAVSSQVSAVQQQLSQSQAQVEALKTQVEVLRAQLGLASQSKEGTAENVSSSLQTAVNDLREQNEVLQSEVATHEQTKLETLSKYPLKVTGLLLFSSFLNNGKVDSIDDPVLVLPRANGATSGSLAATARQSILGLDASGPLLWNAKTHADINIDFFGGLAYSDYATSAGIVRLRTAHARLDWPQHALLAEIDAPIISPLSPTSYVGVGEAALAWSGNLWSWSPQLVVKNKAVFGRSTFNYDFALMDPPAALQGAPVNVRQPNAAEQSRQPGYEVRTSYQLPMAGRSLQLGASGYYSRQAYSSSQHVDSWAGTTDWIVPLTHSSELSGEFYRGRALGGLGGGGFKDIWIDPISQSIYGLDATGGWAQVKFRLPGSFEANIAFGQDSATASELYDAGSSLTNPYSSLARNRAATGNFIFRPKTYLLFSTEFRYLQSWPVKGAVQTAPIVGFAAGYLF